MADREIKTTALVLKRINYKDADKLLTMYTRDLGRITALAKGARKIESKKRGTIEPFNIFEAYLIKTKGNWYILTQTNSLRVFKNIRKNNEKIFESMTVLDTVLSLTADEDPNPILFALLSKTFRYIDQTSSQHILSACIIKIINMLGYHSQSNLRNIISISADITVNHLRLEKYLHTLLTSTYEDIVKIPEDQQLSDGAIKILPRYILDVTDVKIKTLENPLI